MEKNRHILHIDMDAFYASVEIRDNPALAGKPVLVGGTPRQRGVVAACSYAARHYGVHSAMPMSQALRLCPQAVVLPVRMSRYVEVSTQIRNIFFAFTPEVEPLSLDEAFLDVSGCLSLFGSAELIGRRIKQEIREKTGLTASVGVAPNKFLAKLASDLNKPDGFRVITERDALEVLDPLPVSRIWGIGKVTSRNLEKIGIHTILQLRTAPRYQLSMIFGNQTEEVLELAQGMDTRPVEPHAKTKSISAEETFPTDIQDKDVLEAILMHQIEEVAQRLRSEGLQCRTLTLKLRYGDFKTITRSSTLDSPTAITKILLEKAGLLLEQWHRRSAGPLRLLGFGASGLSPAGSGQQLLFSSPEDEKQKKVDAVFDQIREKYGRDSLKHAVFFRG